MTTETAHRFAFGKNWKKFSTIVSGGKIDKAVENLGRADEYVKNTGLAGNKLPA